MTDITWTCTIYITGNKATESKPRTRSSRTFFSLPSVPAGGGCWKSGRVISCKCSTVRPHGSIRLILLISDALQSRTVAANSLDVVRQLTSRKRALVKHQRSTSSGGGQLLRLVDLFPIRSSIHELQRILTALTNTTDLRVS